MYRCLWSPYVIGRTIIFLPCDFYLLSSFLLFSSPNLSGRRLDVYHTSTHSVALVQIQNARLKCAARGSLKIHDAKMSPFWHHHTILSGCIFASEACIDNRKNLLNIDTSSTCPMPNVMAALPNIGGALCSKTQSLADAQYWNGNADKTRNR